MGGSVGTTTYSPKSTGTEAHVIGNLSYFTLMPGLWLSRDEMF